MNQDFHAPQARANAARYEACLLSAPSKASGSGGIAS
jgi:hypothetical protein